MTRRFTLGFIPAALSLGLFGLPGAAWSQPAAAPPEAKVFPHYSTAGFFAIEGSPRQVLSFNPGWRYHKGDAAGAEAVAFNDAGWTGVNLPDGLEITAENDSGMRNYQGPAWYRKHFHVPPALQGKKTVLYFEAVMGKCKVWVNGTKVAEHFGGYLPFAADITKLLHGAGVDNVVAVWADNSDDPTYPPGKAQDQLDFTYMGGIYRDVYLIATTPLHVTHDIFSKTVAGGGVFVGVKDVNGNNAELEVRTEVVNEAPAARSFTLRTILEDASGKELMRKEETASLQPGATQQFVEPMSATNVHLWHPDDPYLHFIRTEVAQDGKVVDSLRTRFGIRLFEMRGADGFFVNKKYIGHKLSGVNHHEDYVYVGNAVPNSSSWRDVKLLREGGSDVVRTSHYPQDPAFMDACDELGMLVAEPTPGWQFFNAKDPIFEQRVKEDTTAMVRRDRNRPSVFLWEIALNETGNQPVEMLKELHRIIHAEFPFPGAFTVTDANLARQAGFDFYYGGSTDGKNTFTREYGDQVDNWTDQNSLVRIPREWGEAPLINQLMRRVSGLNTVYGGGPVRLGSTLWAGIDCQRGYHVDPFSGGVLDLYRIPRYAYYLFKSQYDPTYKLPGISTGPMVYIAHELTQISAADVVVLTNCEEVRLTWLGKVIGTQKPETATYPNVPHPPVIFKNVFNFQGMGMGSRIPADQIEMVAEGLIGGQVAVREVRKYPQRAAAIRLELADAGIGLTADGSDFVPVRAYITDKKGVTKVLDTSYVTFEVTGPASIIGDASTNANPMKAEFGVATALIRAGGTPGEIHVKATSKGFTPAEITFESKAPAMAAVGTVSAPPRVLRTAAPAPAPATVAAKAATPAETQKLNAEIKQLQQELTVKEQANQELQMKLNEKK